MKLQLFCACIILILATLIIGQTRRSRDEEYIRKTITINRLQTLSVTIKACDPDGDPLLINIDDLPDGAILSSTYLIPISNIDPNDCDDAYCQECFQNETSTIWYAANLTWTPEKEGEYRLHIHAIDDKGGDDWVVYIINVIDIINENRPPVL